MSAIPYELATVHMVFDDEDSPSSAAATATRPSRYDGRRWSAARAAQRVVARRRLHAGWATVNPDVAPALRRRR